MGILISRPHIGEEENEGCTQRRSSDLWDIPLVTSLSKKQSGTWLSGKDCRTYKAIFHLTTAGGGAGGSGGGEDGGLGDGGGRGPW